MNSIDKQLFIEKFQNEIFDFSNGTYMDVIDLLSGEDLKNIMIQKVSNQIDHLYPRLEYFVECDIMKIPLSEKRDNRIDHVLENSELKREIEILLTISYKINRVDEGRKLSIHLNVN